MDSTQLVGVHLSSNLLSVHHTPDFNTSLSEKKKSMNSVKNTYVPQNRSRYVRKIVVVVMLGLTKYQIYTSTKTKSEAVSFVPLHEMHFVVQLSLFSRLHHDVAGHFMLHVSINIVWPL